MELIDRSVMKRIGAFLLLVIVFFSCVRENEIVNELYQLSEGEELTFYATTVEEKTRTGLIPGGGILWSPHDTIRIFYCSSEGYYTQGICGDFTSTNTVPESFVEFKGFMGPLPKEEGGIFIAVYPHSDVENIWGKRVSMTLPSIQVATEDSFADDLFASIAYSTDHNLYFRNIYGGVKLRVVRDDIDRIVFRANYMEKLAGKFSLVIDEQGQISIDSRGTLDSVTLVAPAGKFLKQGAWYYLTMIPQLLERGYTVDFYHGETLVDRFNYRESVQIKRAIWGVINMNPQVNLEPVDMGLSVLWANNNLGAFRPEGFGDYYSWGETEPKESFWTENYKWYAEGSWRMLTKYCPDPSYGANGYYDDLSILELEDDPAFVKLGDQWRVPTHSEWEELENNCDWEYSSINGIKGYWVTSRINGKRVFLPVSKVDSSKGVYYMSSTVNLDSPGYAFSLCMDGEFRYLSSSMYYGGHVVRPVYGGEFVHVTDVFLDQQAVEMRVGDSTKLKATILPEDARDKSVTWSSSDESIVQVSPRGIVYGLQEGSAVVTVTTADGGKIASCSIIVHSIYSSYTPDIVDLGLSVKWASTNLGANSPEDYGYLFAWGELEPKNTYDWSTYKWCLGSDRTLTRYCTYSSYGINGFTDSKSMLEPVDDAAHMILGDSWRLPTREELDELHNSCTWEWVFQDDVSGYRVIGPNGNSIFLPAAGYKYDNTHFSPRSTGFYYSSSINPSFPYAAFSLNFRSNRVEVVSQTRAHGKSIRPVFPGPVVSVEHISLDKTEMVISVGEIQGLVARFYPEGATIRSINWSSSDNTVASVSSIGEVKGLAEGTTIITATSLDGGKTASCHVTVKSHGNEGITPGGDINM